MLKSLVCACFILLISAGCIKDSVQTTVQKTITNAAQSVAQVYFTPDSTTTPMNIGSAVLITPSKLLTAWHVVDADGEYSVLFPDGQKFSVVKKNRLGLDDAAEIFIAEKLTIKPIPIEPNRPKILDPVYAIGYPMSFGKVVTSGVVSGFKPIYKTEAQKYTDLIIFTAGIGPGNSGGALLNSKGKLIGIVVMLSYSVHDLQLAISNTRISELLKRKSS